MDDLNGFAIAVSELDQERRRLVLARRQEREIREREKRLSDLKEQELTLRNQQLQQQVERSAKSAVNLRTLLGAWQNVAGAEELPEEEAISRVEKRTDQAGREWTNLVVRGGKAAKVKRAEDQFQAALEMASETPEVYETLFNIVSGVNQMRTVGEETQLKHSLMRAQIAKYMSEIQGTGRDLTAVGKQLDINDQSYKIMLRDLLPETEEDVGKRWDDRIRATKDTAAALGSNINQLVSNLALSMGFVKEFAPQLDIVTKATNEIKNAGRADATTLTWLEQTYQGTVNIADGLGKVVQEGSPQGQQLQQLRKSIEEYRRHAQVLANQFAERENELVGLQKKKEIGTVVFHSLITDQNRPPETAAGETVALVDRLFRSVQSVENVVTKTEVYQKASSPAATPDDIAAAHQQINSQVAAHMLPAMSQRGQSAQMDIDWMRRILMDNLKQKRALRFSVSR